MSETVVQSREAQLGEYHQTLRQLSRELERAMHAITRNSAAELEDSIACQQALSEQLAKLSQDASLTLGQHPLVAPPLSEQKLKDQIRAASVELQQLNSRYSALLHHASHSVALMVSLFSSFQGSIQEGSGDGREQRALSCRI